MLQPFYDPTKSYQENYEDGPFGYFSAPVDLGKVEKDIKPRHTFLGYKVHQPFGIPAGPLLNSNFIKAAFAKKFDICVYKTVRTATFPCHPFPNVLPVEIDGDLTLDKLQHPVITKNNYAQPLSITNSFGVPSKEPEVWQADVKKAISYAGVGQVLVLSFMGTVRPNQSATEFVADFTLAAKLAHETGAKVLEVNLSCPNIGNEGLVCYNLEATAKVAKSIRSVIGNTPLILKVGYYQNQVELAQLAKIANEYANGISAINTLQTTVLTPAGEQALPGNTRLRSGICGVGIKWAGLDMVQKLSELKRTNNYQFHIEGVGGVMNRTDYDEYRQAGADSVMSATGAMWNSNLAVEISESN